MINDRNGPGHDCLVYAVLFGVLASGTQCKFAIEQQFDVFLDIRLSCPVGESRAEHFIENLKNSVAGFDQVIAHVWY